MSKRKVKTSKKGIMVFDSPFEQDHRVIDNWNNHRLVTPGELHFENIKNSKSSKTALRSRFFAEQSRGLLGN